MPKIRVLENPDTGDVIFFNKVIKIKSYDCDADGYYKYTIKTTDGSYTDFYSRVSNWHQLLTEYTN